MGKQSRRLDTPRPMWRDQRMILCLALPAILSNRACKLWRPIICCLLLFLASPAIRLQAQSFSITNFSFATNGSRVFVGNGLSTNYYLLYSGATLTNLTTPVAVLKGTNGPCVLLDNYPQTSMQFYRVLTIPAALDSDGDGIPDALELMYNPGTQTIDLTATAIVFVNGANNLEYFRTPLSGTLAPGQYLVAASTNVTPAAGSLFFHFSLDQNAIQNGAPDGVLVINTRSQTVLDSFSYEGAITSAIVSWFSRPINLVRGTPLSSTVADSNVTTGSLARLPNGASSFNDTADWGFTANITPGAANVP